MRHTVLYDLLWANIAFLTHPEMRIKCASKNAHYIRIKCAFLDAHILQTGRMRIRCAFFNAHFGY